MNKRRVVVTGMGIICPTGNTVEEAWNNAAAGKTGIGTIQGFDTSNLENHFGGEVKGFDPVAMEVAAPLLPGVEMCSDAYCVAEDSDAIIVVTDWNEFKQLDLDQVRLKMRAPNLLDGRNIYDVKVARRYGFNYRAVGRGFDGNGVEHKIEQAASAI